MASKRHVRRSMCGDKIPHETKENAYTHMKRVRMSNGNVYHCPFCHKWHIGHKPKVLPK